MLKLRDFDNERLKMRQYETYKCPKCGNEVEVQKVGGGELVCCGEKMECITKDLTEVNLMKAFAGESMARNKYEFYGDYAEKAGYRVIADHFREAAKNERKHAKMEFEAYKEKIGVDLKDIGANLLDAAAGERYEHEIMYPDFSQVAKEEGHKEIASMFKRIGGVEVEHEREYLELKQFLDDEKFFKDEGEEVWVCGVCGHVHRGKTAPKVCPVCDHPQEHFRREFLLA